jgi:hypothetical protein
MQPRKVRHDPAQLLTDLARSNSTNDSQAVKLDRALAPVPQLNMDVSKQVVTGVHHHARCREFVHDRHGSRVGQLLHYVKPDSIRAQLEAKGQTIGVNDLHIAAHARSEGLALVSNKLREFDRIDGLMLTHWPI